MIKRIGKVTLASIFAALVVGVPLASVAADTNTTPAAPSAPASPSKSATRFGGTVGSIDKTAKTIEVDHKNGTKVTVMVTSDTTITRGGKPATLDDAMVGDAITGSGTKGSDGSMTAKKVTLKAAPAAK